MKILVSAYLDRNFGDDMMVYMLANELREHEIYLDSDSNNNNSVLMLPFEDIPNVYRFNLQGSSKERLKQIKEFDAYIKIGGSMFMISGEVTTPKKLRDTIKHYQKLMIIKKLKKYGIPYFILGCNTGPFQTKRGESLALKEFAAATLVTVRDKTSYEFVSQVKSPTDLFLFPDILLSCPIQSSNNRERNCLGISAYRSSDNEVNYASYKKMAEVADQYIDNTGGTVILYALDVEHENDLSAAHTIKHFAKRQDRIEIVAHAGEPANFIESLNRCSTMLSVRFHSAIMAMRLGIPFLPIAYSNKMNNLLDDIGYTGKRISIKEMKNLDAKEVVKSLLNHDDLCSNINWKVFEQAQGHMRVISNYFKIGSVETQNLKGGISCET